MANFDEETILKVWQKATIIDGYDKDKYRQDYAGAWIQFDQRGCQDENGNEHSFGWEIDHQKPVCQDGCDELYNLKPLHWRNNRRKDDNYPKWETCISSNDNKNIDKVTSWVIKK